MNNYDHRRLAKAYPTMIPYVGSSYVPGDSKSLMLIGESHYLPDGAKHRTPDEWYSGDQESLKLTATEIDYISTQEIFTEAARKGFPNKAHSIYRLSLSEINKHGPNFDGWRIADEVVFYNFFQRPAIKGESLQLHEEDVAIANAVFTEVVNCYRPAFVVFLSIKAYKNCRQLSIGPRIAAVPHPGCRHWNRKAKSYGNRSGKELLAEIATQWWRTDPQSAVKH